MVEFGRFAMLGGLPIRPDAGTGAGTKACTSADIRPKLPTGLEAGPRRVPPNEL